MRGAVWTTCLVLCICAQLAGAKWTLEHQEKECDNRTVYIMTAKNETSLVHFVFAADRHVRPPAIIVLYSTYLQSQVVVNCTAYNKNETFRGSLTVDAVTASYGAVIYELCDYEDASDSCSIVSVDDCVRYFGSNLDWERESVVTSTSSISFTVRGTQLNDSHDLFLPGGGIVVQISIFDTDTQPTGDYYYKVAGGLGMAITITIDRLKVLHPRTRVAPVLLLFSNQSLEDADDFLQLDGYSEGVADGPGGQLLSSYLILNRRVSSDPVESDFPPGFVHLTPASWTDPMKNKASMRSATLGPRSVFRHHGRAHKFTNSLVYAYYRDRFNPIHQGPHTGFVGIREQWINLGSPGDGFYRASNYSSWTMVLGLGTPAMIPVATGGAARKVLITLAVLTVVSGTGGIGFWYYRRRRSRQGPNASIFRYESPDYERMHNPLVPTPGSLPQPPAPGVLPDDPDLANAGPGLLPAVEPFQQRKAFSLFGRRSHRSGASSRQPLLPTERPPDYNAVVSSRS